MLSDLIKNRLDKLNRLKQAGFDPYPASAKRTLMIKDALARFQTLGRLGRKIFLVGRIRGLRDQGRIIFADLEDESGRIQVVLRQSTTKNFNLFQQNSDIGDFIQVTGKLFKTKRGEKSLEAETAFFLVKSLRPLPSNYYGIGDVETRLRQRYLDLLMSKEVREMFIKKSRFWRSLRDFLLNEGFLEVETPVLELLPGGAEAEPFQTHHRALNEDFYLRISLEIALKKLLVGGFEKIFEIGRVFRNEGIDAEHLQDYTALEFYYAYADYEDLMKLVEKMYKRVIKETFGTLIFEKDGKKINWGGKWPKIDYFDFFREKIGLDLERTSRTELFKKAKALKLKVDHKTSKGRLIDVIFKTVREEITAPSFLMDPPLEIEPLAKRHRLKPGRVERFQVVAYGTELGKGFSELNDPLDQRERFLEQERARAGGDKEAQRLDEEFLTALEYGMPPAAGFGVSERLFAVLAGKPIRETVFFPPLKKLKP